MTNEPESAEHPSQSAAFGRIIETAYEGQANVKAYSSLVDDLTHVRDDELVMLGQVRALSHVSIWPEALTAEVARRTIVALNDFRSQSKIASDRLETLTRWLIAFTVVLIVLSVTVVVHDLVK